MSSRKIPLTAGAMAVACSVGAALTLGALGGPAPAAARETAPDVRHTAAPQTTTVRYGPFTIPAAGDHGHDDDHGGGHGRVRDDDHGNGTTHNRITFNIKKPCDNCFITGFKPNLVYPDGSNANVNTGPMLHHAVLGTHRRSDTVCKGPQRVFASGNERMESVLPSGYGVKVKRGERWNMLYDLMNHEHKEKTVYISITYTHESAAGSQLKPVTPIWMDAGGCLGSIWDAPEGVSEKTRRWRSTISGRLVHMRGHLHHGGHSVRTENLTTGKLLCKVVATEGGSPEFIDPHGRTEISDMPPCSGDPLGTIHRGDVLQVTGRYEIDGHTHDNVMGIMVGWVAKD
ncbi:hypothetical protein HUT19_06380 [Streptomyces sp. NA02950]|uniref:hypothetical protein n=1 Tax=Streptomyces sp. NA02950 TaxID=2742137 RepID=UPI00158FE932|nr:hypothetical protein [Streptomyces sp. NA02950]QKV91419.1 hypothetical protein HUT19_06380 [Streptomyces sp. NA02950]